MRLRGKPIAGNCAVMREPLTTPREAMKPDAPKIHPKGNILSKSKVQRGDVERAFAESAHVIEDTYNTQFIEHMFLEPESCLAIPEQSVVSGPLSVVSCQFAPHSH